MTTRPQTDAADRSEDIVLTVAETAKRLKVSAWTINRLIRERTLGSIQIGARRLVPSSDIDAYIERLRGEEHSYGF